MNIKLLEEVLSISDTALRCQRVLDEVQPILRQLMDEFKSKYAGQVPELMDYHVHTYEVTLRTTMHDARNPKYAEKKKESDIGKKAFVELIEKKYFQTEFGVLYIELSGLERNMKIVLSSDFYPFWEGIRTQENARELDKVIASLSDDMQIFVSDKDVPTLSKSELITFLRKCVTEKRRPRFYFGTVIDFDQMPSDAELVDIVWNTWNNLEPIRHFIREEAVNHALSLTIFEQFNSHQDDISIWLYDRNYDVKFSEVSSVKANQRRQKYGIYDKGQLLTDGMLLNLLREPNEALGVYTNGYGHLFTNLRTLHGDGRVVWSITKGFRYHKKDDKDINKVYQEKTIEALKIHDFQFEGNSFYVGTWDNDALQFVESIADVKKRLIMAVALIADCTEVISLPKDDFENSTDPIDDDTGGVELIKEVFEHDFNLATILSNINESPLTYSDSIIRDFHLNLVSLEDKHFVILNGISGTGKTKLCLIYANAVYGQTFDAINPYLKVIPVRPD